ncbi:MAG: hypothetical protein ABIK89_14335 [Planctomycetota bacterium]
MERLEGWLLTNHVHYLPEVDFDRGAHNKMLNMQRAEIVRLLRAEVKASSTATPPQTADLPPPKIYCMSWREILDALELKNDPANRSRLRSLNDMHDGPMMFLSQGGQPKVERSQLIEWWNRLEDRFHESTARKGDRKATVAAQHNYGRDEIVVPDIAGSVKRRRAGTSEKVGKHRSSSE